jgi:hypothetical protein
MDPGADSAAKSAAIASSVLPVEVAENLKNMLKNAYPEVRCNLKLK